MMQTNGEDMRTPLTPASPDINAGSPQPEGAQAPAPAPEAEWKEGYPPNQVLPALLIKPVAL